MGKAPLAGRPLTPRMRECLASLRTLRDLRQYPASPNEIALVAGYTEGGRRHGSDWSGHMGPANRVIFALIGLERRGLVRWVSRRDDLSGMAIEMTLEGERT